MAKLTQEVLVQAPFDKVKQGFNQDLFTSLTPPFIDVVVRHYQGEKTGDTLSLELGLGPIKMFWEGKIIDHGEGEDFWYFIDEGTKLPFPLKYWHHEHRLEKINDKLTKIIDRVHYQANNVLCLPALSMQLKLMFWQRKKQYREYFMK